MVSTFLARVNSDSCIGAIRKAPPAFMNRGIAACQRWLEVMLDVRTPILLWRRRPGSNVELPERSPRTFQLKPFGVPSLPLTWLLTEGFLERLIFQLPSHRCHVGWRKGSRFSLHASGQAGDVQCAAPGL